MEQYTALCREQRKKFESEEVAWRKGEAKRLAATEAATPRRWHGIPASSVIDFWRARSGARDLLHLTELACKVWSLLPSSAVVERVHAIMHTRDTSLRNRQLDETAVDEGLITTNSGVVSHLMSDAVQWRCRADVAVKARRQIRAAGRHAGEIEHSVVDIDETDASAAAAAPSAASVTEVAATDNIVPDFAEIARDAQVAEFLRIYVELVADADAVLTELDTNGDEICLDEENENWASDFGDDAWEAYRRSEMEMPNVSLVVADSE